MKQWVYYISRPMLEDYVGKKNTAGGNQRHCSKGWGRKDVHNITQNGGIVNITDTKIQKQKILEHLQKYGSITPKQAMDRYGIMRLGARIYDLKKDGYDISRIIERGKNRNGENSHWAKYFLKRELH